MSPVFTVITIRFSGLRSLKLADGELQLENAKNTTNPDIEKVQVILLNTRGQVSMAAVLNKIMLLF